jgi:hypothetical protein
MIQRTISTKSSNPSHFPCSPPIGSPNPLEDEQLVHAIRGELAVAKLNAEECGMNWNGRLFEAMRLCCIALRFFAIRYYPDCGGAARCDCEVVMLRGC